MKIKNLIIVFTRTETHTEVIHVMVKAGQYGRGGGTLSDT